MKKFIILFAIAGAAGLLLSRSGGERNDEEAAKRPDRAPSAPSLVAERTAEPATRAVQELQSSVEAVMADGVEPEEELPPAPARGKSVGVSSGDGFSGAAVAFVLSGRESTAEARELYDRAKDLMAGDDPVGARRLLTEVYLTASPAVRAKAVELLDRINEKLVFDPSSTEGATLHTVRSGETLSRIASRYGTNWRMLQRINNISRPELIRLNQRLKVLEGTPRMLVSKSRLTLTLFIDDYFVREYPVGLGRDDRTPAGVFTIDSLLVEADWYPPWGGVIKYEEEGHLIGTRWIGFEDGPGAAGYGIHGTNDPDSIGEMISEGCIRMLNHDVEELYDFLVPGVEVKVID